MSSDGVFTEVEKIRKRKHMSELPNGPRRSALRAVFFPVEHIQYLEHFGLPNTIPAWRQGNWFDNVITLAIVVNVIVLAMFDPLHRESTWNKNLSYVDDALNGLFLVEMILRVIGFGFRWYIRDVWRTLDAIVVLVSAVSSAVNYIPGLEAQYEATVFTLLRTARVLRPFKTMSRFTSIRILAVSLVQSFTSLLDITILFSIFLAVFSVAACGQYRRRLRPRCVNDDYFNKSLVTFYKHTRNFTVNDFVCRGVYDSQILQRTPKMGCSLKKLCDDTDSILIKAYKCPYGYTCFETTMNPMGGFVSFDNTVVAAVTLFVMVTLEGWADVMYDLMDSTGFMAVFFCIAAIMIGSFFILKLAVVLITINFQKAKDEADERIAKQKKIRLRGVTQSPVSGEINSLSTTQQRLLSATDEEFVDSVMHPTESAPRTCWENLKWKIYSIRLWTSQNILQRRRFTFTVPVLITLNIILLMINYYGMSRGLIEISMTANIIFTILYSFEIILRIIGTDFVVYIHDMLNIVDIAVVVISWLDFYFELNASFVRSFRALRVIKLLKAFPSVYLWITIIIECLYNSIALIMLIFLFVFVFACMGMQFFGGHFCERGPNDEILNEQECPRANFDSWGTAMITCFQLLTGDNWNEVLYDGMRARGPHFSLFFIVFYYLGNNVLVNILVGILLTARSSVNSRSEEQIRSIGIWSQRTGESEGTLQEREMTEIRRNRESVFEDSAATQYGEFEEIRTRALSLHPDVRRIADAEQFHDQGDGVASMAPASPTENSNFKKEEEKGKESPSDPADEDESQKKKPVGRKRHESTLQIPLLRSTKAPQDGASSGKASTATANKLQSRPSIITSHYHDISYDPIDKDGNVVHVPQHHHRHRPFSQEELRMFGLLDEDEDEAMLPQNCFRKGMRVFMRNRKTTLFINFVIAMTSVSMAVEDPIAAPDTNFSLVLYYGDFVFTGVFVLEWLFMSIAYGFGKGEHSYIGRSNWNVTDFLLMLSSVIGIILAHFSNTTFLRSVKAARTIRPLRFVKGSQALRTVLNALLKSLPSVKHIMIVGTLLFTLWGVMGVQLFKGRFYECSNPKLETKRQCELYGEHWHNSINHFDHIFAAFASLFVLTSVDGWPEIMHHGMDSREEGMSMQRGARPWASLYFIFFIILSGFFFSNLFTSVLIDTYESERQNEGGSMLFLSQDQKAWREAHLYVLRALPPLPPSVGEGCCFRLQLALWKFVSNAMFENFIYVSVALNCLVMGLDSYPSSPFTTQVIFYINFFFVCLFTVEAILKVFALRKKYFESSWNKYDFFVVVLSIFGLVAELVFNVKTVVSVFRAIRVLRLLRPIRSLHKIQKIMHSFFLSLIPLGNVVGVMFLVFFIFAIMGMNLFGRVKHNETLNDNMNFDNIGSSILVLLRVATGGDTPLIVNGYKHSSPPYCTPQIGNCSPSAVGAQVYFYIFVIVGMFILLNLFTAVILDAFHFDDAGNHLKMTPQHAEKFVARWKACDPEWTMKIRTTHLLHVLNTLSLTNPLSIHYHVLNIFLPIEKQSGEMSFLKKLNLYETSDGYLLLRDVILSLCQATYHSESDPDDLNFEVLEMLEKQTARKVPELDVKAVQPAIFRFAVFKMERWWLEIYTPQRKKQLFLHRLKKQRPADWQQHFPNIDFSTL